MDNTFYITKNQISGIWYIVVLSNTAIPHFDCASLYNTWQALYCVFFFNTLKVCGNSAIRNQQVPFFLVARVHMCVCVIPFVVLWYLTAVVRERRQCRDAAEKLGSGGLCLGRRCTSYATTWTSAPSSHGGRVHFTGEFGGEQSQPAVIQYKDASGWGSCSC